MGRAWGAFTAPLLSLGAAAAAFFSTLVSGLALSATAGLSPHAPGARSALAAAAAGACAALAASVVLVSSGTLGPGSRAPFTLAAAFCALAAGLALGARGPPAAAAPVAPLALEAGERRSLAAFTALTAAAVAAVGVGLHAGAPSLLERVGVEGGGVTLGRGPIVVLVPLLLTPLAIGWCATPGVAAGLGLGGASALVLTPLVLLAGLPSPVDGALRPADALPDAARAAAGVIAAIGTGAFAGAALGRPRPGARGPAPAALALALLAAALAGALAGPAAAAGILVGVGLALVLAPAEASAGPAGTFARGVLATVGTGVLAWLLQVPAAPAAAAASGAGFVVAGADAGSVARRLHPGVRRSALVALLGAGVAVVWALAPLLAERAGGLPAPHAQAFGVAATRTAAGLTPGLLALGALAGVLVQRTARIGVPFAVGLLVGPAVALLVFAGSAARTFYERGAMRAPAAGDAPLRLLRLTALAVGIVLGEAVAFTIVGLAA